MLANGCIVQTINSTPHPAFSILFFPVSCSYHRPSSFTLWSSPSVPYALSRQAMLTLLITSCQPQIPIRSCSKRRYLMVWKVSDGSGRSVPLESSMPLHDFTLSQVQPMILLHATSTALGSSIDATPKLYDFSCRIFTFDFFILFCLFFNPLV